MSMCMNAASWIQIDLGERRAIDVLALHLSQDKGVLKNSNLAKVCIECCDKPDFYNAKTLTDRQISDYMDKEKFVAKFSEVQGRYLRLAISHPEGQSFLHTPILTGVAVVMNGLSSPLSMSRNVIR